MIEKIHINNNEAPKKLVSFEQTGEAITFSLPNGETLSVLGRFSISDLTSTSYEGYTPKGKKTQVEFFKHNDGSLLVLEIKIDGQVVYPDSSEELRDVA